MMKWLHKVAALKSGQKRVKLLIMDEAREYVHDEGGNQRENRNILILQDKSNSGEASFSKNSGIKIRK